MTARPAAALLMAQFAAMWGAFFILAPAINWPASLDLPPDEILPLIRTQAGAVFAGYLSYLTHALLLIPLAILAGPALRMTPTLAAAALALGALAALAKALGILRWLVLMPGLATTWADPATTDATRDALAVVYQAFNAYAGGVGELLGVGLMTGAFTVVLSVALLRDGARLTGYAGIGAAALLFATLLSAVGIESPLVLTLSGILWQFWSVAVAIHLWRGSKGKPA
jgi:Domain of unknown function (DUF4386)